MLAVEESEQHVVTASSRKWQDPLKKSAAFGQLQSLMEERIIYIDGAMGTSIQKHRQVSSLSSSSSSPIHHRFIIILFIDSVSSVIIMITTISYAITSTIIS